MITDQQKIHMLDLENNLDGFMVEPEHVRKGPNKPKLDFILANSWEPAPEGYALARESTIHEYKAQISESFGSWTIVGYYGGNINGWGYGNTINPSEDPLEWVNGMHQAAQVVLVRVAQDSSEKVYWGDKCTLEGQWIATDMPTHCGLFGLFKCDPGAPDESEIVITKEEITFTNGGSF